jgi:hypothetical protein
MDIDQKERAMTSTLLATCSVAEIHRTVSLHFVSCKNPKFACNSIHIFHSHHQLHTSFYSPLIIQSNMKPTTPSTTTHRCHDVVTARHKRSASTDGDLLEIEMSASPDEKDYESDVDALLPTNNNNNKTSKTKTRTTLPKTPGTRRTIFLAGLVLMTLASLSTVAKEAWTWDPARICGQWSTFQDQRATATSTTLNSTLNSTRPPNMSRSEFFVANPSLTPTPRTVFFTGTPWMLPTNHSSNTSSSSSSSSSSSIRVYYPVKLVPPTFRTNDTNNTQDDDDDNDDVTRFYPTVDSQDTSMERRVWPQHELDPHCEPMADWQTTFYPICNELHGTDMKDVLFHDNLQLLSSKGFWRHAWQMDDDANQNITTVLKTFKCVDAYRAILYLCAFV